MSSFGFNFTGQRVLVTGANGQLGRLISQAFVDLNAVVYATDVHDRATWGGNHERLIYSRLDISSRTEVDSVFSQIFEKGPLDVLINNAGIACFEPFLERLEKSFDDVLDVNLKGTFNCIQAFSKKMISAKKEGCIVNIGSIYGVISPDPRVYTDCARNSSEVYGATKAGVVQMSRYFAVHLAPHSIRVNTVSPGGIFNPENPQGTDFVRNYSNRCPMGRMAKADEMLGAILYFSSAFSSYTTGQNLVIDGGLSAW